LKAGGARRQAFGGADPYDFPFPQPVGTRRGFLVDIADHDLLPPLFGARCVEFRAGAELSFLNTGALALAWSARVLGLRWDWAGVPFEALLRLLGGFGSDAGALGVEVSGRLAGSPATRRCCLLAEHGGDRIPVLPVALLAPRLACDPNLYSGLIPLNGWIGRETFEAECVKRGLKLMVEEKTR